MKQNIQQLKKKCKSILQEESNKQGIEVNINPITVVEYYDSDVFKQKTKLQQIKEKYFVVKPCGFFDPTNSKIMIFIDRLTKHLKADSIYIFPVILFSVYHEYKHQLQFTSKETSKLEEFIIEIERFMMALNPRDYNKNHEKYYIEIDANLYAYHKTIEYTKNNDPKNYEQTKLYLGARWIFETKHCQINYDSRKTFDKFYQFCKSKKYVMSYLKIPGLDIFLDENNKFRALSSIINKSRTESIDEAILLTILGSQSYLNQLDISKLTKEERLFMLNIINKVLKEESHRMQQNTKYYAKRKVNSKKYLDSLSSILKKIKYLYLELKEFNYFINQKTNNSSTEYCKKLQRIKEKLL